MALQDRLISIASRQDNPSVTISLNTHRTHPDNLKDEIVLKNLVKDAENRLLESYGKRDIEPLLTKLTNLQEEVDFNTNLESLHIFLSNDFQEIVKSTWQTPEDKVEVDETFAIRQLIKDFNRSEEYLILKLTMDDVHLYTALNDSVTDEIKDEFFPMTDGKYEVHNADKGGDPNQVKDRVRELFNRIDKAVVQVYNETSLDVIVIASDQNYKLLLSEADRPAIYVGHSSIDNNSIKPHELSTQAWEVVKQLQFERRGQAIGEMKEAVSQGLVVTDLDEIYRAAIDGRGDLLIVNTDYSQAVKFTDERNFDLVEDETLPDVVDDIVTNIAWEVISKKGRVIFTRQEDLEDLGPIALKTRY